MRAVMGLLVLVAAAASFSRADARPYESREQRFLVRHSAWCLRTGEVDDCGYATLQQCLVSRSGVGGSCDPNPFYVPLSNGATGKPPRSKPTAQ